MKPDASDGLVTSLLALAEFQGLRTQAFEGCAAYLRNAAKEGDLRGWSLGEIEPHFERCSLVFDHGILRYPFVETQWGLYVRDPKGVHFRDLQPIGHYRLITFLNGTPDDDYFVLDTDKPA